MKIGKGMLRYNPFNRLYDEGHLAQDIRRSLNFMLLGNIFGTICGIVCGGSTTAMVGLASMLGAGDLEFGLLSAIPSALALLQIPFSMMVNRTHKRKRYLLTYGLISRALWLLVGLVPLIVPVAPGWLRLWTVIFLVTAYSAGAQSINPCWFPWMSDLCPDRIRGRWLSYRESILAFISLSFGILIAWLLDALPEPDRYVIVFLIGGLTGIIDLACFAPCTEVEMRTAKNAGFFGTLREVSRNKPFMALLVMWTGWCFSVNMFAVYTTPYCMNMMGLNYMQMMVFGTAATAVLSMVMMPRWGRLIQRLGTRKVMFIGSVGASLVPLVYLLSAPGSIWPTLLHSVIGQFFYAACNLTATSMQLTTSPQETRASYVAVFSAVTALVGTMTGTLLGGEFLEACTANGWFSGGFDRYMALGVISTVLRLAVALLLVPRFADDKPEE